MLRVLVVSNVRLVQEGIGSVLAQESTIEVVGTADVQSAHGLINALQPDVVLFDAARREDFERLKAIAASARHSKIVAFGVKEADEEIVALAAAGTAGYVPDCAVREDIARLLDRVMCDELLCSPRAAASLYHRIAVLSQAAGDRPCSHPGLSRRELQIAQLIVSGLTNKQIARQLGIEATTVKNHVHNMCEKLSVHRRGEIAAQLRAALSSPALPRAASPDRREAVQQR